MIAVHDNGKGIPAEKQHELFEEGRLNSTFCTKGEKGTGLGLMLSWILFGPIAGGSGARAGKVRAPHFM